MGWFESAKYDDNTPVAGVAAVQEFGSGTIPPRPFFRPTVEEKQGEWSDLVADGLKAMLGGQVSASNVMNGLGLTVQADVKNAIASSDHLALSPATIAIRRAKGNTNTDPLRDSGVMLATLTYEVN